MSIINQRYNTEVFPGSIVNGLKDKQNVAHELQDLKAREIIDSQQTLLEQLVHAVNVTYAQQLQSINADVILQNNSINTLNKYIENLNSIDFASVFLQDHNIVTREIDNNDNKYDIQYIGAFYNNNFFEKWCAEAENLPINTNRIIVSWNISNGNYRFITNYFISEGVWIQAHRAKGNTNNNSKKFRKITYTTENNIRTAVVGDWVNYNNYTDITELTESIITTLESYFNYANTEATFNIYDAMREDPIKNYLSYIGAFTATSINSGQTLAINYCQQYYNLSKTHSQTFIFYLPEYKQFGTIQHIPLDTTHFKQYIINNNASYCETTSVEVNQYNQYVANWGSIIVNIPHTINGLSESTISTVGQPLSIQNAGTQNAALQVTNYPFLTTNWGKSQININTLLNASTVFSEQQQIIQALLPLNSTVNNIISNKLNEVQFSQMLIDTQNIIDSGTGYDIQYIGTFENSGAIEKYCAEAQNIPTDKNRIFIGWSYYQTKYIIITTYKVNDTDYIQSWRDTTQTYNNNTGGTWRKLYITSTNGVRTANIVKVGSSSWYSSSYINIITSEILDEMHTYYNTAKSDTNINKCNTIKSNTNKSPYTFAGAFDTENTAIDWCSRYYNLSTTQKQTIIFYLGEQFLTIIHIPVTATTFIQYYIKNGVIKYRTGTASTSNNVTNIGFEKSSGTYTWVGGENGLLHTINGIDIGLFNNQMAPISLKIADPNDAEQDPDNNELVIVNYPFIAPTWGKWSLNLNTILSSSSAFARLEEKVNQIEQQLASE